MRRCARSYAAAICFCSSLWAADGVLDTTFSGDGKLTTFFDRGGTDGDFGYASTQLGDGRIFIAGASEFAEGDLDFAVTAHHPNGNLDTSFSTDGKAPVGIDIGGTGNKVDVAQAVATMPDGRVVACGKASYQPDPPVAPPPASRLVVVRLQANGIPDPAFGGGDGRLVLTPFDNLTSDFQNCHDLVAHPDGRVVLPFSNAYDEQAGLIRLEADGDLDPTFGGDGISELVPVDIGTYRIEMSSALELPGGKYLAVGFIADTNAALGTRIVVARYTAAGLLDSSFDGDGRAVVADPNLDYHDIRPSDVALDAFGRLVVLAEAYHASEPVYLLFRLTSGGAVDSSFGFSGWTTLALTSPAPDYQNIRGLTVQGDGKIVVAGDFEISNSTQNLDFGAMRLTSTATELDTTFGSGGRVQVPFDLSTVDVDILNGLSAVDGRPLLTGYVRVGDDYDFALARLTNAYTFVDGFESATTFFWSATVP